MGEWGGALSARLGSAASKVKGAEPWGAGPITCLGRVTLWR